MDGSLHFVSPGRMAELDLGFPELRRLDSVFHSYRSGKAHQIKAHEPMFCLLNNPIFLISVQVLYLVSERSIQKAGLRRGI